MEQQVNSKNIATLFVSFDLVNCTQYKTFHKGTWGAGVSSILGHIIETFGKKSNDGYRFWKALGDEVIFTKSIPYMFEISDILEEIYQEVVEVNRKIKDCTIGDETTAKLLSVKATVWVAGFSETNQGADNFYTEYQVSPDQLQSEYLGTDIDAGFRIAKYTASNRVVISFEIAAFYFKDRILRRRMDRIHFLGLRQLKGIWDNLSYPIFMYHGAGPLTFDQSITETSLPRTAILQEYIDGRELRMIKEPYVNYEEQVIATFCENSALNSKIEQLMILINEQDVFSVVASAPRLRVHYSVLCYAVDGDEVQFMITTDRRGVTGLGGAVTDHNLQYLDTIQLHYLEEFGVNLEFVKDSRYHDPIPLILTTYHMESDGKTLDGSVLLAKISADKFWGDLSENFEAHLLPREKIKDFVFYDCEEPEKELFDQAMKYL